MSVLLIHAGNRNNASLLSASQDAYGPVERVQGLSAALNLARSRRFEAFVLDLRHASFDGLRAVRELRDQDQVTAIMTVSGPASPADRIRLLEAGADDCLSEPFSDEEFLVRLRVLLRRAVLRPPKLSAGDLELDTVRRQAMRQGRRIPLTPREFAVLEFLLRNAGQPVSRRRIFEEVWNREPAATNIVDVYINYLRSKVDRTFEPKLIRTVYGLGYLLVSDPNPSS